MQEQGGPLKLAHDIVSKLGPNVGLSVMQAIARELGVQSYDARGYETGLASFDAVGHVARLDLPRGQVGAEIERLEYLREVGLALGALLPD